MLQQIVISSIISAVISFAIINHENIEEWLDDMGDWLEEKISKKRKDENKWLL